MSGFRIDLPVDEPSGCAICAHGCLMVGGCLFFLLLVILLHALLKYALLDLSQAVWS